MQIQEEKWYIPSEIAKLGLIVNSKNKADTIFVLRLIKRGKLKAQNYATATKPFYRVLGRDILQYKHDYEGFEG